MDNKSYALGLGIAQNLMGMGIKKGDLNVEDFAKAMSDAFANKPEMHRSSPASISTNLTRR